MTKKAREFREANRRSPVVYGSAIGDGGRGAYYRLEDGKTFRLGKADCAAAGMPLWPWDFEARRAVAGVAERLGIAQPI